MQAHLLAMVMQASSASYRAVHCAQPLELLACANGDTKQQNCEHSYQYLQLCRSVRICRCWNKPMSMWCAVLAPLGCGCWCLLVLCTCLVLSTGLPVCDCLSCDCPQGEAEYAHLQLVEGAIERHGLPFAVSDPTASQHQQASITSMMKAEHVATKKAMLDTCKVMMVRNLIP